MGEKTKAERMKPAGAIDELTLQNAIRSRHKQDWPDTILQLVKRVQATNRTWANIVMQLMTIDGLTITWQKQGDGIALVIRLGAETEVHEFTKPELHEANKYVEVLFMDKVDHSELIAKAFKNLNLNKLE